jgi:glycosyltransferase involved in cell wall biosynthesis
MRVALYIGQLDVGGAEGQALLLARGLRGRGHDVLLVTEEGRTAAVPADLASCVKTIPNRPRRARFQSLREQLKAFGPDVLHCQLTSANLWGALARPRRRPRAARVISFLSADQWKTRRHLMLDRWLAAAADGILVNSAGVASRYRPVVGTGSYRKVRLIYNGVDTGRFDRVRHEAERPAIRRDAWGVPPAAPVIANVANFFAVKNHLGLLAAFARVCRGREGPGQPYLVLVGDGPEKENVLREAAELEVLPYVRVLGRAGDVERHLAAADIFALPSHAEGFSNALLEAMASSLPCVATAVGGNAEALALEAGVVVPPGDVEGLAVALAGLLEDEGRRTALGARARARAVAAFGLERMIDETAAWYEELAAKGIKAATG